MNIKSRLIEKEIEREIENLRLADIPKIVSEFVNSGYDSFEISSERCRTDVLVGPLSI